MRFSLLAALALAMLAGCDGRGESSTAPPGAAERERPETRVKNRLPSRLNGLSRLCANAASSEIALPVRCPSWLPRGAWGGRALGGGGCDYLFELHRRSAGRGGPYHAFVGGRCGNFSLRTRSGRWPVKARRVSDLGLIGSKPQAPGEQGSYFAPARLRVLRTTKVADRAALLLVAEPFPAGGVHGGHIAVVWNQGGAGYALTLHFVDESTPDDLSENMVLRAAASMGQYADGGGR